MKSYIQIFNVYFLICISRKACVKQTFKTSWDPGLVGSISLAIVTYFLSLFASAVLTVYTFLLVLPERSLSAIISMERVLTLPTIMLMRSGVENVQFAGVGMQSTSCQEDMIEAATVTSPPPDNKIAPLCIVDIEALLRQVFLALCLAACDSAKLPYPAVIVEPPRSISTAAIAQSNSKYWSVVSPV